ncbi:nucleotide sugar dehydrogenase [Alkalicoccobacillus murimartini]|uniref:UDP-N-acetyl-D-glucosamine dehydrogenase n=1 Tax=Alkalicoccobacillus murimartini TaxID=171685 RepID=A0ABT9YJ18_9BACI|nr:nucleotide sugar dehydrogenase [Alkalicoccobacillus murimartini]MDQ0207861.1 UDP-N-acetyl-D-glucosamine dehydrogenase [Alkalicoccobacillus murimartini]
MATKVAVIGLGYVGLPLASLFHKSGYDVVGIDVDPRKIKSLDKGESYLSDFTDKEIKKLTSSKRFSYTTDFQSIQTASAIILCVPTPLKDHQYPDLSYLESATHALLPFLKKGQLVVLESSTFPGTTEEVLVPLLQKSGLIIGEDLYIGYSPERIDPGNKDFTLAEIPKVVSGVTDRCREKTVSIYEKAFHKLVPVDSPRIAEMTKILENTQRLVNISFMNEMSQVCHQLGIDIWQVITAASTKPYGFTSYFPGPGIGGHCIPVDPLYLKWKANQENLDTPFIDLAKQVNDAQPSYIVSRLEKALSKEVKNPSILLIGLTYKKDVNDVRESVSIPIMEQIIDRGWSVDYHDPFMEDILVKDKQFKGVQLEPDILANYDAVLILTDHSHIDYNHLVEHSKLIVDTRNCIKGHYPHVIRL